MSLVVLHLVAAVGYLTMEETVKALEAKVAKLEANLAKKSETNTASSYRDRILGHILFISICSLIKFKFKWLP